VCVCVCVCDSCCMNDKINVFVITVYVSTFVCVRV
jgi:hypothetical protein